MPSPRAQRRRSPRRAAAHRAGGPCRHRHLGHISRSRLDAVGGNNDLSHPARGGGRRVHGGGRRCGIQLRRLRPEPANELPLACLGCRERHGRPAVHRHLRDTRATPAPRPRPARTGELLGRFPSALRRPDVSCDLEFAWCPVIGQGGAAVRFRGSTSTPFAGVRVFWMGARQTPVSKAAAAPCSGGGAGKIGGVAAGWVRSGRGHIRGTHGRGVRVN